ncbi:MAG: PhoD-like phosphatase N-terminal domain-containing protein, partial [Marinobacter sp.]|nr:PhoD-like phosphatase N-terminal domain-containing protein [Marinobacter sp.]
MDKQRRAVLKGLAATSFTALTACGGASSGTGTKPVGPGPVAGDSASIPSVEFRHGVASGDPMADRVILWTRVTPTNALPRTVDRIPVQVTVARDREMLEKVARVNTFTGPERDFCVKIDATGLRSGTWYYYQFSVGNQKSMVGRTRTFPEASQFADRA